MGIFSFFYQEQEHPRNTINGLLACREAARQLGYVPSYVAKLCRDNKLQASRIGRDWYIRKDALTQFVQDRDRAHENNRRALIAQRRLDWTTAQAVQREFLQRAVISSLETVQ